MDTRSEKSGIGSCKPPQGEHPGPPRPFWDWLGQKKAEPIATKLWMPHSQGRAGARRITGHPALAHLPMSRDMPCLGSACSLL
jgi:hypothetical protein